MFARERNNKGDYVYGKILFEKIIFARERNNKRDYIYGKILMSKFKLAKILKYCKNNKILDIFISH